LRSVSKLDSSAPHTSWLTEKKQMAADVINFKRRSLKLAIWNWIFSWFHVHEWRDEKILQHVDDRGTNVGEIFIQRCECGLRRSQKVTSVGIV
jgi:hypothetical protein